MLTKFRRGCVINPQNRGIPRKRGYNMTISFAGHSFVPFVDEVKEKVKEEMRKSIDGAELVTCYLGGYGSFDALCARACKEIKMEHEGIEIVYVAPYIGDTRLEKIERSGKTRKMQ